MKRAFPHLVLIALLFALALTCTACGWFSPQKNTTDDEIREKFLALDKKQTWSVSD